MNSYNIYTKYTHICILSVNVYHTYKSPCVSIENFNLSCSSADFSLRSHLFKVYRIQINIVINNYNQ